MNALLFFRPLFVAHKRGYLSALLLSFVALAAGVMLLGLSGWFLTAASLTTAAAAFNLFGPSSAVRGLSFLKIVSRYGEKLRGHDATLRTLGTIRAWLFRQLMPRVSVLDRGLRRGDLVSRLTSDVDALDTAFLVAVGPLVASLATGGAMVAALAFVLPHAACIYATGWIGASVLVPLALVRLTQRDAALRAIPRATADLRIACLDAIDGHADLLAFGHLRDAEDRFANSSDALAMARQGLARRAAAGVALIQLLAGLTLLGVLAVGLKALETGAVAGPVLVGSLLAIVASFEANAAIVRSVAKLAHAESAASRLRDLATSPVAIADPLEPQVAAAGGQVAFERIGFGHDPGRPVLRNLDLVIEAGEHVAIRGASGSGKSTLLQLLLRLAEPQAGIVRVAGVDVAAMSLAALRGRVAFLEQNAPVFRNSLRANLLIGRPDASEDELWRVLHQVRLTAFVRTLPGGLDAMLGEDGRTLSAGQGRRLCLARVLLSGAEILALDEPTSGLDLETERAFFADLAVACAGRTILVVTHAETENGLFDRQFKLLDGRLIVDQTV